MPAKAGTVCDSPKVRTITQSQDGPHGPQDGQSPGKRREVEAAEKSGAEGGAGKADAKKKPAKKAAKPAKRKSRSKKKSDEPVRLKAFWGVYNQSLKQVARFEYH